MTRKLAKSKGSAVGGTSPVCEDAQNPGLSERRRSAVNVGARKGKGTAMLMTGARHDDVARECGVSTRQVERWAAEPEVREKVVEAVERATATAAEILNSAAGEAAEAALAVMRDAEASPGDRLRAALAILDRTGHEAGTNVNIRERPLPMTVEAARARLAELAKEIG